MSSILDVRNLYQVSGCGAGAAALPFARELRRTADGWGGLPGEKAPASPFRAPL